MSIDEYGRLAEKMEEVLSKLAVLDSKLTDYSNVRDTTLENKRDISSMRRRCGEIQEAKKADRVPLGQTKSGIIVGLSVGIVMLALGIYLGSIGIK